MKILLMNGLMDQMRALRAEMGPFHEVWAASNGKVAENLFRSFKPDAVVMYLSDLNPDHHRRIVSFRKMSGLNPCAVLVVAPFTHFKLIQQVLDWGVDDYIAGPCDMRRIKNRLGEIVEGKNLKDDGTVAGRP